MCVFLFVIKFIFLKGLLLIMQRFFKGKVVAKTPIRLPSQSKNNLNVLFGAASTLTFHKSCKTPLY